MLGIKQRNALEVTGSFSLYDHSSKVTNFYFIYHNYKFLITLKFDLDLKHYLYTGVGSFSCRRDLFDTERNFEIFRFELFSNR